MKVVLKSSQPHERPNMVKFSTCQNKIAVVSMSLNGRDDDYRHKIVWCFLFLLTRIPTTETFQHYNFNKINTYP